jgi:hypothetical protein
MKIAVFASGEGTNLQALGLVIVIRPESLAAAKKALPEARLVGEIVEGKHEVEII